MLKNEVDTLVLGCTHYPFIQPVLESILPEDVKIIDPAPAVARQVRRRLKKIDLLGEKGQSSVQFYTTGNVKCFKNQITELIDNQGVVKGLRFS